MEGNGASHSVRALVLTVLVLLPLAAANGAQTPQPGHWELPMWRTGSSFSAGSRRSTAGNW